MAAVVVAGVLGSSYVAYTIGPGTPPQPWYALLKAEPGPARAWEADLGVGTYTSANMRNGNLLTAIPIVSWSGSGPDVAMLLYHNSANVDSTLDLTRGIGFDLGPGWSTSYSAQLILDPPWDPTKVLAIADDGTQDEYAWEVDHWEAPPGVFDVLTEETEEEVTVWRLTHKDQSYHEFDDQGLLIAIVDATGNTLTVSRDGGILDTITDAAGRVLTFTYDHGRLEQIEDPCEGDDEPDSATLTDRQWDMSYDAQDRLATVTDPMTFTVSFGYDSAGRITSLTDKDTHTYEYEYQHDGEHIERVTDPEGGDPPPPRLTQQFVFPLAYSSTGYSTTYVDRRGSSWTYRYNANTTLSSFRNPLGAWQQFGYDADRNRTLYRDPLSNDWTATYDDRGNLLTVVDPLGHAQTWVYDEYNNVTSYIDPEGNTVTFHYEHADYPTLLTRIVEPEDGQGNPPAVTTLDY